jgi:hypothetical protein
MNENLVNENLMNENLVNEKHVLSVLLAWPSCFVSDHDGSRAGRGGAKLIVEHCG